MKQMFQVLFKSASLISETNILTFCSLSNVLIIQDRFQQKRSTKPAQPDIEQNSNQDAHKEVILVYF